jgi:hypothetical protein
VSECVTRGVGGDGVDGNAAMAPKEVRNTLVSIQHNDTIRLHGSRRRKGDTGTGVSEAKHCVSKGRLTRTPDVNGPGRAGNRKYRALDNHRHPTNCTLFCPVSNIDSVIGELFLETKLFTAPWTGADGWSHLRRAEGFFTTLSAEFVIHREITHAKAP